MTCPCERASLAELAAPATRAELERCGFAGRYGVGNLIQHTSRELSQKFGFSRRTIIEIKELLAARGLTLRAKLENWPPPGLEPSYGWSDAADVVLRGHFGGDAAPETWRRR